MKKYSYYSSGAKIYKIQYTGKHSIFQERFVKVLVKDTELIKKKATKKKINSIIKPKKTKKKKKETEIVEEPVLLNNIQDIPRLEVDPEYKRLEEASLVIKENKEKDPYDLFVNYYDILLGETLNTDSIKVVEEFLDNHKKIIENIEPITKKDLEDTYNVYKNNEDLREEVYKTTENIERLLTYEINEIFNEIDINDSENLVLLTSKVEPIANYIKDNLMKDKKKK